MRGQEVTFHVKLLAKHTNNLGYTNYVFEDLEFQDQDYKYFMCVRFPNWESPQVDIDSIGYVSVKYVKEGVDKWFDGDEFVTYKYTNIIFLKFIPEPNKATLDAIIID